MVHRIPRRRFLAGSALAVALGLGGCLTLDPTVTADTSDSVVFEEFSTSEPWASGRMRTSVSLTPNATTTGDVTTLAVISESGNDFDTVTLDSGQTSAILYFPANQNTTVTAVDSVNGTVIETRTVTTGGNTLF